MIETTPPEELDEITLLFIGEVAGLGAEPPFWSDRYSSWQTVEYRLVSVLRGAAPKGPLAVEHGVVKSRPTARADRPGLAPEMFRSGARWIVGAQDRDGVLFALYEAPWSPEHESMVRGWLQASPAAD